MASSSLQPWGSPQTVTPSPAADSPWLWKVTEPPHRAVHIAQSLFLEGWLGVCPEGSTDADTLPCYWPRGGHAAQRWFLLVHTHLISRTVC